MTSPLRHPVSRALSGLQSFFEIIFGLTLFAGVAVVYRLTTSRAERAAHRAMRPKGNPRTGDTRFVA